MLVAAVVFSTGTAEAAITKTLKYGMKDAQVKELQQNLNAAGFTVSTSGAGSVGYETTSFGAKTKLAVQAYQRSKGLTADGVFGPASRAAWGGTTTGGNTTLPAGCTTTAGFSSTTGQPCNGSTTTTQTGPVTVSLASDTPASAVIIAGQANAELAKFTFTGTGTVNSVTLTRGGVSDQSTLSNVYLYDGATRLTDGYSFNNAGVLTMNNVNLAVNGSKTITVKADVASGTTSYTISVRLSSVTVGTTVNTVSLSGNEMSIATGTTVLGTAKLLTASPSPSAATINAGTSYVAEQLRNGLSTDVIKDRLLHGELNQYFRPEFLNRFDGIVLFKPLAQEDIKKIAELLLRGVAKDLEAKGVELRVADAALEYFSQIGFDPEFGARPLRRVIQEHVENKLAELILSNQLKRRDVIVIGEGGEVRRNT
jgi:peptidoglycan hydrolase-like protein with peptidoglycan-binding domain